MQLPPTQIIKLQMIAPRCREMFQGGIKKKIRADIYFVSNPDKKLYPPPLSEIKNNNKL